MSHVDEYTSAMLEAMDLVWGEGFMAPGGEGNVAQMVRGLALQDREVLDIGSGQGRPACILASDYGARVTGTDLEAHLVARAQARAAQLGLQERVRFMQVEPGPLVFPDQRFDHVVCSGAMTQIEDKASMYRECWRVLRPGGSLSCYDWMKCPGPLSDLMLEWFELEGLTYALRTPEAHRELLQQSGFTEITVRDKSNWYRRQSALEYEHLQGALHHDLQSLLGTEETAHFIEAWRVLAQLCARGELLQVYTRAYKAL